MSTITRERLEQLANFRGAPVTRQEEQDLARIALASLEAEPVGYFGRFDADDEDLIDQCSHNISGAFPLYTAPPAPVSVPECFARFHEIIKNRHYGRMPEEVQSAFDECAAMLQGAEPVMTAYKLPMQPIVIDAHGTLRFKENPIVRALLDYATEHGYGLNEIAQEEFDAEDQMQLAQLIGYSLSGYGTLSYVTDESYERAAAAAPQQEANNG